MSKRWPARYVRAGSQIILTNTFRGNPVSLADLGVADKAALINREGARLSRNAADPEVLVFASMGPIGKSLSKQEIDARSVTDAFKLQAEALAEAGADALVFETFSDVGEARLAVRAAKPTGLPIVVSFAFCSGPNLDQTITGADPETAARAMIEEAPTPSAPTAVPAPNYSPLICRRLRAASGLPIWIKPSAGLPSLDSRPTDLFHDPCRLRRHFPALFEAGASFVGGCCGTSPEFIRELAAAGSSYDVLSEAIRKTRRARSRPISGRINKSAQIHTERAFQSRCCPPRCTAPAPSIAARCAEACRSACNRRRGRRPRPWPSVPGSQAAIRASLESSTGPKIMGRPESSTVITGTPASRAFFTTARSSGGRDRSRRSRLRRSTI